MANAKDFEREFHAGMEGLMEYEKLRINKCDESGIGLDLDGFVQCHQPFHKKFAAVKKGLVQKINFTSYAMNQCIKDSAEQKESPDGCVVTAVARVRKSFGESLQELKDL